MRDEILRELDGELHDLCQPLTTLQCQLELGRLLGDPASLKEAVEGGIGETQHIFAAVERMRQRLAGKLVSKDLVSKKLGSEKLGG